MRIALCAGALLWVACDGPPSDPGGTSGSGQPSATATLSASALAAPVATASASASASVGQAVETPNDACPDDMVAVTGAYCPDPVQKCLEHHEEYEREQARIARAKANGKKVHSTVSERCLRYREPSVCISKKKRPMEFCIDRYEWPNRKGEVPLLLVDWYDARRMCKEAGKRLCTVDEFNFACEGEEMLPYTYGYERDDTKCNIDKPYVRREKNLARYDKCMATPSCKAELERLDQREPAGSRPECVSPFGVYDLNGNINEWVLRPGKERPNRSGLKSGWWGPVRGRCRPTVGFHKESDYGYEVGFRCCADPTPSGD